jgi:hypothetical protein
MTTSKSFNAEKAEGAEKSSGSIVKAAIMGASARLGGIR